MVLKDIDRINLDSGKSPLRVTIHLSGKNFRTINETF